MSVRTTADEHKDDALQNITNAINHISAIVVEEVWGYEEYSQEYKNALRLSLNGLLDIRNDLR